MAPLRPLLVGFHGRRVAVFLLCPLIYEIWAFRYFWPDRSAEAQQFGASGLNLVIAAIVFWNSTYIADAIAHLRATEQSVPDA